MSRPHNRRFSAIVHLVAWLLLAPNLRHLHATGSNSPQPNIILILADDLGFSDLGAYGSEIQTPHLDRLASQGLRFTQFYNAARCCPTRAALLTGLYPHQAGMGHMTSDWTRIAQSYSPGLNDRSVTIAQLLCRAGYKTYLTGKWHTGGFEKGQEQNYPLSRGFDRFYGTYGGGNFFFPDNLKLDWEDVSPGEDYYFTDAVSDYAVQFLREHVKKHNKQPFFLHLCYTAPHFPLHARPEDIARYRGKYREGWDKVRQLRFERQKQMGIVKPGWNLSPRDPLARPWDATPDQDQWDLRMAVHAAMVDRMDQGVGRVMAALRQIKAEENTLVLFLSDNGASAEALDSWPDPRRGHKPGSEVGTKDSHRCLELGWANAANTPFREHKMWVHEGGVATPLIACWPAGIKAAGAVANQVGHVIDLLPTFLALAGMDYPPAFGTRQLLPLEGKSLVPVLKGQPIGDRTLAWEHEGNRAIRQGDWKLVASYGGKWELYNLAADRTETNNLADRMPEKVKQLSDLWQEWADRVGVVPWEHLPGSDYQPTSRYRKKSEPVGS
ncbi:MAG: arylsulfatase [Acidobacteriota bacterium]